MFFSSKRSRVFIFNDADCSLFRLNSQRRSQNDQVREFSSHFKMRKKSFIHFSVLRKFLRTSGDEKSVKVDKNFLNLKNRH